MKKKKNVYTPFSLFPPLKCAEQQLDEVKPEMKKWRKLQLKNRR